MDVDVSPNYNIFSALHDSLRAKNGKKLRFAKCSKCERLTPYRLNSVELPYIKCKKCGTSNPIMGS